ncbi:MAG: hypothetical protein ACI8W8_000118 [Rhodothermales bacterium]|jgi:hypothetical protein
MTAKRITAIALIYCLGWGAWIILGSSMQARTHGMAGRLGEDVQQLWGTSLVQQPPRFSVRLPGSDRDRIIMPNENRISVTLDVDHRRRGLLWYPTYVCEFAGSYSITNPEAISQRVWVHFDFPRADGTYDAFSFQINEAQTESPVNTREGISEIIELGPGESAQVDLSYRTRGLGEWRYAVDPALGRLRNLSLVLQTNFAEVDYPEDCLSPSAPEATASGMTLRWEAADLLTQQDIGVIVPSKLNPGPLTTRITFFAPICLIFFFILVLTINIVYAVPIHPMHYLFVTAGFFAFHLLLAYLVDLLNIHLAFAIAAVVSVVLVTTYLRSALGGKFPMRAAIGGQLFFLVLFSYTFFIEGMTGLTVAIGSVITLAVLMRVTAGTDWELLFSRPEKVKVEQNAQLGIE